MSLLLYTLLCFGGAFVIYLILALKINRIPSKAARNVYAQDNSIFGIIWIIFPGFIAVFFLPYKAYICFFIYIGFLVLGSLLTTLVEKLFKLWIRNYNLRCSQCQLPMKLLNSEEEKIFENPKIISEVEAGRIDFECWKCTQCNHSEQFEVVLPKVHARPTQSSQKTSSSSSNAETFLDVALTLGSVALDVASSSSSSSGSSFGGGSFGGGGSSGNW